MRTVLTIGREPDNDLVINLPIVSGHHARVTWGGVPGQALIEDLGSSNGTAIGQLDRKITRSALTASDLVYFGNHPVPAVELLAWVDPSHAPPLVLQGPEMVVGRDPTCHRVIDRSTISGRHARLKREGDRVILEDLKSSNGTFLNGQRLQGPTEVRVGDLIGFGVDSFRLAIAPAPVARTQRMDAIKPSALNRAEPTLQVEAYPPAPGPTSTADWVHPVIFMGLILQAPILALVIGLLSAGSVATALFLLSLAAVWFGLSNGVFVAQLDPRHRDGADYARFWLKRLLILGGFCVVQCVLAEFIVLPMGGLKGPGLPTLVVLILAAGVGLSVGLLIVLLAPNPPIAWSSLAIALVGLCLFGGGPWSLPRSTPVIRLASNAAPSRWAFEGLLLSESDVRASTESANPGESRDLAEDYFPASTDRMGARADLMALASMLIGLLGFSLFLIMLWGHEQGQGSPSRL